jgi:hypothetical protein
MKLNIMDIICPRRKNQMPKDGFTTVTFPDVIIKKLKASYQKEKDDLKCKGIFSFTGYVVSLLEDKLNSS